MRTYPMRKSRPISLESPLDMELDDTARNNGLDGMCLTVRTPPISPPHAARDPGRPLMGLGGNKINSPCMCFVDECSDKTMFAFKALGMMESHTSVTYDRLMLLLKQPGLPIVYMTHRRLKSSSAIDIT